MAVFALYPFPYIKPTLCPHQACRSASLYNFYFCILYFHAGRNRDNRTMLRGGPSCMSP